MLNYDVMTYVDRMMVSQFVLKITKICKDQKSQISTSRDL